MVRSSTSAARMSPELKEPSLSEDIWEDFFIWSVRPQCSVISLYNGLYKYSYLFTHWQW